MIENFLLVILLPILVQRLTHIVIMDPQWRWVSYVFVNMRNLAQLRWGSIVGALNIFFFLIMKKYVVEWYWYWWPNSFFKFTTFSLLSIRVYCIASNVSWIPFYEQQERSTFLFLGHKMLFSQIVCKVINYNHLCIFFPIYFDFLFYFYYF